MRGTSSGRGITTLNVFSTVPQKLNDTGITKCVFFSIFADCTEGIGSIGSWFDHNQDAEVGRDYLATNGQLTKVGAGIAGFDFTKISAAGEKLPATATAWSCVLDNQTGLMWEIKTKMPPKLTNGTTQTPVRMEALLVTQTVVIILKLLRKPSIPKHYVAIPTGVYLKNKSYTALLIMEKLAQL